MKKNSFTRIPSDIFPPGVCELTVGYARKHFKRVEVRNSPDVADIARTMLYADAGSIEYAERFYVMMCDRSNKIFAYKLLSQGGIAGTVVDPKLLYQVALLTHASSIILVHNHPSGNPKPSETDIVLTRRLCECGKLMDIPVLDHLIVTVDGYYSFGDEGLI